MHTHDIYVFMSLCSICAEISVLLQSPASRVPCAHLGLCLTGLDAKPTCGTLAICVLQSMMMLEKHAYRPTSNCVLSVDLCAYLPD